MPGPYLTPGVYIEEVPSGSRPIQGVGTAVAAFIGFTYTRPAGNTGQPVFIASWNQFVEEFCTVRWTVKDKDENGKEIDVLKAEEQIYDEKFFLPHSVFGYFQNGGRSCYIQSIGIRREQGPPTTQATQGAPSANLLTSSGGRVLELSAKQPGISVEVSDATGEGPIPEDQFRVIVRAPGQPEAVFDNLTMDPAPKGNAKSAVAELRKVKGLSVVEGDVTGSALERRPKNTTYTLTTALAITQNLPAADAKTFQGNATNRTGLGAFEEISDVTMVVCPDLMSVYLSSKRTQGDREAVAAVQNAILAHCAQMKDRFAILDPLPDLGVQEVYDWRMTGANYSKDDGKYGALYYPWIHIVNPLSKNGGDKTIAVPPSGHMAGLYARTDAERGVHKAPANETLRGAVKLAKGLIDSEQAKLNPVGINCIRSFPGRGILVWGARTLAEAASEWRYINVRRLFNYIEESIYEGTQWVVFEPNDLDLWERVKRTISAFLTNVWRDGALFGATPGEAFYVKCDADLNPPSRRDNGELVVEIGIAPVKPAEFVIFRFKQVSGGGEISE